MQQKETLSLWEMTPQIFDTVRRFTSVCRFNKVVSKKGFDMKLKQLINRAPWWESGLRCWTWTTTSTSSCPTGGICCRLFRVMKSPKNNNRSMQKLLTDELFTSFMEQKWRYLLLLVSKCELWLLFSVLCHLILKSVGWIKRAIIFWPQGTCDGHFFSIYWYQRKDILGTPLLRRWIPLWCVAPAAANSAQSEGNKMCLPAARKFV